MESNRAEIQQLRSRLDVLIHKQKKLHANVDELTTEIQELQTRISRLVESTTTKEEATQSEKPTISEQPTTEEKLHEPIEESVPPVLQVVSEKEVNATIPPQKESKQAAPAPPNRVQEHKEMSNIESFLGENLANKIGIAIILIGIGVGVKYAIDKNILGPGMRIALGYLAGGILISFAFYLKKKYENLSAVLFAGGMAVAYFVTFIAYDFYGLFSKMVAFGTMLVLTVVTSLAAIRYDKQIIAIIGLVGAYAVPFLLQDGTGTTFALFVYMTIINAGILFLAFRKNWQPVFSVAFSFTWFVYFILSVRAAFWLETDYSALFLFSNVFYVMFYAMLIANKMKYREQFAGGGTTIVILNSIFGYITGIIFLNALYDDAIINGVYTLLFAASQGLVTFITARQKEAVHRLYYLSFGFMLIYATLSIPMMFDGNWITILWALQAALFFWIGRRKDDAFFEKVSYLPVVLSFISLVSSWSEMSSVISRYPFPEHIAPVLNPYFLAGLVLAAVLFFMSYVKHTDKQQPESMRTNGFFQFLSNALVYFGVIVLFLSILKEINIHWEQKSRTDDFQTTSMVSFFSTAEKLKVIWMLIAGLVYTGALQLGNHFFMKDKVLSYILGAASATAVVSFLFIGLFNISLVRDHSLFYSLNGEAIQYSLLYSIRYFGYLAMVFVLWSNWLTLRHFFPDKFLKRALEIIIHVCLVWIVCSELIHWKRMNGGGDFYRAGLTIIGGMYSFGLIAFGIWKKKTHLRILALILFGITLLKLFIYDIAKVDSGGKTIAFISLGILLLIISFLYTKYKHLILRGDDEEE